MSQMNLLAENARYRAERDQARRTILLRDNTVRAIEKEQESLKNEIKSLQQTVQKQNDALERQKKTIKVQSDKIKAPAETNVSRCADLSASTSFTPPRQPRPNNNGVPLPLRPQTAFGAGTILQSQPMPPPTLPAGAYSRRGSEASMANHNSVQNWVSSTPAGNQSNGQAMVPWRGPQTPSPPKRGSNQSTPTRRGSAQQASNAFAQPPPVFGQSSSDPTAMVSQHHARQGSFQKARNAFDPTPIHPPPSHAVFNSSNALVVQDNTSISLNDWNKEFTAVFALSETWAHTFCATPVDTANLATETMHQLKGCSSSPTAIALLSSSKTRAFLVAALINHWLTDDVFRFHIMKGFSTAYDAKFREHMKSLENAQSHIALYRAHATLKAEDVGHMCNEPSFPAHLQSLISARTASFWGTLSPLLSPTALPAHAYTELSNLYCSAFTLGFKTFTEPLRFDFEYPTVMPATWFNAKEMVNRDPDIREDAATVNKKGRKIRLAFSPCVKIVNLLEEGMRARVLVQAGVLVAA